MAEALDILFIHPGDRKETHQALGDQHCAIEPPIIAAMQADYLRRRGYGVAIYDVPAMQVSAAEASRVATEHYAPRLVVLPVYGFQPSASTQTMPAAGRIARLIKQTAPDLPIVMLGTHPAALPRQTMQEEAVDWVCTGEGPLTLEKLLQALDADAARIQEIPSLWWRDEEGTIQPPRCHESLITDLSGTLSGLAWDLLPMERYRAHNWHCFDTPGERTPYVSLYTSLGCPFQCNFCCINAAFGKPGYRMWSPEVVLSWVDHLVERYGIRNIKLADEMFVLNKRHVTALCQGLIERDYGLNIWAYSRVDTAYPELMEMMQRAGFSWLVLGIESANPQVRDGAEKPMRDAEIINAVRRVEDAGIHVLGNYLFGLPHDTPETMEQTITLALQLNTAFANFYSTMAYPGSALYRTARDAGRPLPNQWQGYAQHGYETYPLATDHCSAAEILAFRDAAWDRYFTDPSYLAKVERLFGQGVLKEIRNMTGIKLSRRLLEEAA
ncbi:MAG: cobalamin-dependent protein [Magnetococcales bacterium]|nr:cobalamin-dependent protein [Magnetococcales bacterium]